MTSEQRLWSAVLLTIPIDIWRYRRHPEKLHQLRNFAKSKHMQWICMELDHNHEQFIHKVEDLIIKAKQATEQILDKDSLEDF